MSRRGATPLRGIIPIDKPAGMTSHDVVARIRRATGEGRVGHAGTLDPDATGLLVVLLGPYTRLEPYLAATEKAYDARIAFGRETDTDDASGQQTVVRTPPPSCFEPDSARAVLVSFLGESLQVPPAYSAIKVGGRTAHRAARAGETIELAPRPIEVFDAWLDALDGVKMTWDVGFRVSKGTYIRALARDVGRACGSAAHLAKLRRTASGTISLDDAFALDDAVSRIATGRIAEVLLDPFRALGLRVVNVAEGATRTGSLLSRDRASEARQDELLAVAVAGELAGIYRANENDLSPVVVFPERIAT